MSISDETDGKVSLTLAACLWAALILPLGGCAHDASAPAETATTIAPARREPPDAVIRDPERAYETCLAQAARFADDGHSDLGRLALVVAPMCHPQFSRIEDLELTYASPGTQQATEDSFDRRQVDSASAALRQERLQSRVAAMPPDLAGAGR